jgi:glutathione S-transferase
MRTATDFIYRQFGPEDPTAMSELESLWPLKKFPVLLDDGRTYLESSIIIEHLARRHPGAVQLIPADPDGALETRMMDRCFDNYVMTPIQKVVADFMRAPDAGCCRVHRSRGRWTSELTVAGFQ